MAVAPDYKTLFAFEPVMLYAAKTLVASWVPSGVQVVTHEEDVEQNPPCILVTYTHSGEGDRGMRETWHRGDGTNATLPRHYLGEYRFTCKGFRSSSETISLDDVRGGIRGMCASFGGTFNRTSSPVMTYYTIDDMSELASSYSVEGDKNTDVTELVFSVQLLIKRDAYPELPGFSRA